LEDELVAAFCGTASTVLAAVLTTAGMREFVFYVSDEKAFREQFRAWAQTPKSHRAQMIVRRDPSWSVYRSFAP
jgi:hypothetical protein